MGVIAALASLGKRIGCLAGGETIERGILDARVTHIRHAERRYVLSHRLSYLHIGLGDLGRLPRPWFGYNRRAVAVIRDRDYGPGKLRLGEWIAEALRAGNAVHPGGRIALLTLPCVAGLAFNPVSFWFCHDPEGNLRAVLAEVNSTFGERHCYLCRKPEGGIIGPGDKLAARKALYVSPFLPVEGEYIFRFHEAGDRLGIFISLVRGGRTVMFASIVGRLIPLTARSALAQLARQPLPALRVLMLIHLHAARLYLSGLRLMPRPRAPRAMVSVSRTLSNSSPEQACRRSTISNR